MIITSEGVQGRNTEDAFEQTKTEPKREGLSIEGLLENVLELVDPTALLPDRNDDSNLVRVMIEVILQKLARGEIRLAVRQHHEEYSPTELV